MRTTEIKSQLPVDCDLEQVGDALAVLAQASVALSGPNSAVKFAPLTRYRLDKESRQLVLVIQHP